MPTVTTAQTLKNSDGSASEMFYGVDSPRYVRINENKNLEQELADIYKQISDLSSNINQRITKLDTDLKAEIKNVNDNLSQDISDLDNKLSGIINDTKNNLTDYIDGEIAALSASLGQRIDGLVSDLNVAKSRISTLEGEISTLTGAIEDLNTRLSALENPEANV